jgi:hypothetical protein
MENPIMMYIELHKVPSALKKEKGLNKWFRALAVTDHSGLKSYEVHP